MIKNEEEFHGQTKLPKRVHYKWKVADEPGEFAMISKYDLLVDERYQRKHTEAKVLKMAQEWSWIACGAISVALRETDSTWYVMDGMHRVLAARKRDDIRDLPCMVFGTVSVAQEAKGFLAANTNRKAMTMVAKFKALLVAKDPTAMVVEELINASGRTVAEGGSDRAFSAVDMLYKCVKTDEPTTRKIWPVAVEVCRGKRMVYQIIAGLWYLERHVEEGTSLSDRRWTRRIIDVGYQEIIDSIARTAAFYDTTRGMRVSAIGIAKALNRGLRTNKLPYDIKTEAQGED